MNGILLDAIYSLGLLASAPVWMYRMVCHGRYRRGWRQRFGSVPVRYGLQPIIWIHAVSLGEVNAASSLVEELHRQLPDYRVVISTSTDTGLDRARKLFAHDHTVFTWPLDFTRTVRRALNRMQPDLVILMEGEVWPNFLDACNRRDIPVVIVNARLGADKGYPRYKKLGAFATTLFNRLTAIGVQDEAYAECFRGLGVAEEKIHVTGMMKFDTAVIADRIDGDDALAAELGINTAAMKLLVAGGTGPGEEQMLLEMWKTLKDRHPSARLAVVPRKPERFDEVARLIESAGFKAFRRSQGVGPAAENLAADTIILGDTMGELRKFYSLATAVFVGRSLVPMGGSDMIESAALGKATAFGPYTYNFPQADKLAEHGCVRVQDISSLAQQLDSWLSSSDNATQAGRTAQQYVASQTGATRNNVEMICRILGRVPAVAPGAISTDAIAPLT